MSPHNEMFLYFSQHKFVHFNGTQMTQKDADWRRFLFFFCVSLRVLRQSAFYNSMNGNAQFHTAQSIILHLLKYSIGFR